MPRVACWIRVDPAEVRRRIALTGHPLAVWCRTTGVCERKLYKALASGRCTLATYDELSAALGINGWEIEEEER